MLHCSTYCIHCGSKAHVTDFYSCLAGTEKKIIQMAFLEGTTIKEAREPFNSISSSAARRERQGSPASNESSYSCQQQPENHFSARTG
jgi:hypothetical protein